MTSRNRQRTLGALTTSFTLLALTNCAATSHPSRPSPLGAASSLAEMETHLDQPGSVLLESVASADWQVERAGLINLDHPRAQHLSKGPENIHIYFHAIRHPQQGLYLVDTGVAQAITRPEESPFSWPLTAGMNMEKLKVHVKTKDWLAREPQAVSGVFLSHLHLDHVMGLPDLPKQVPVFVGPGEAESTAFLHMFVRGTNNRLLAGRPPLRTWAFRPQAKAEELAVVDVFQDASVFALHVPGHTPGSTAFVVRTPRGPVLLVGDACHTEFGWNQDVEPGTFSVDQAASAKALRMLRALAKRHPRMDVRLGHQPHRQL